MLLEFYAHSCFALTDGTGRRILIDPYDPTVGYAMPNRPAEVTLVSHAHFDHDHLAAVPGRTRVIRGAGEHRFEGLTIRGFTADHDEEGGTRLGHITLFRLEVEGRSVVHLSDLQGPLTPEVQACLQGADVLLVPCGGAGYTLGPHEAAAMVRVLRPNRVVPMHYRTPFLNRSRLPDLQPVDPFLQEFEARPVRESSLRIEGPAPEGPEIVALSHLF